MKADNRFDTETSVSDSRPDEDGQSFEGLAQSKQRGTLRRIGRWLVPNGGTLLLIALLILSQRVWANPALFSAAEPRSSTTSTNTVGYQGWLADDIGTPLNGTYDMSFRIYDADVDGTMLWEELWTGPNGVGVSEGLFNVMLGSLNPISATTIGANDTLYMGITVGTDAEMTPRVQLGSVPFAVQALTVPDGSVTTDKIADGAVTTAKLAGGLTSSDVSLQQHSVQLGGFGTDSLDFVDIPGSEISVTVDAPSTLLVSFTGSLWTLMQVNSSSGALLTINVDGTDRTDLINQDLHTWSGVCCGPNPAIVPAGFSVLVPVASGTHIVKLRVKVSGPYDPSYYSAGIGYNGRSSTFSVVVLGQ